MIQSVLSLIKSKRHSFVLFTLAVLLLLLFLPANGFCQETYFPEYPSWFSGPNNLTNSVAYGDIDGDGDLDLVCGNYNQSNTLYLNEGGIFQTESSWSSNDSLSTQSIALGDIDGDGDLDLVCGNGGVYAGQSNTLYLNEEGTFESVPSWSSGPVNSTLSVALGDIDGDGDLDLVCGNKDQINTLYLNEGGMFQTVPSWSSGPMNRTRSVALGDIDRDGDLDLVCGNGNAYNVYGGQSNTFYLNEGGTFEAEPSWSSGPVNSTPSVALGDIDGDGDLDLVCGNVGQRNTLYLNEGGTFGTMPSWESEQLNGTYSVVLGDIDGDGDLDLVCGNGGYKGSNTLYLNEGSTFQATPSWSSVQTNDAHNVALGDIDGDGDLDLVCGNGDDDMFQNNTFYLNEGDMFLSEPSWLSSQTNHTRSVALGDIDGDGDLDLACGNHGSNALYLNEGGTFEVVPSWSSQETNYTNSIAVGDIDGDGDLDLVCGNYYQSNTFYLNEGGTFEAVPSWSSVDTNSTYSIALGDIDGDGDLDLVCGNLGYPNGQSNMLYLNEGGTFLAEPSWSSGPTNFTFQVTLGDIDGDGDLDLVCGNGSTSSGQSNTLYLNEGGTFEREPVWLSGPTNFTFQVTLGDIDGDGDLDLACGNNKRSNTLYMNEGGIFQTAPSWNSEQLNSTIGIALGDIDGDGDLDLVCGNGYEYTGQSNTLYLNEGGMFEVVPSWSSEPTNFTVSIALGDIDEDGDLEIVCGNLGQIIEGQSNTSYLGKGALVFNCDPLDPTNHLPNNGAFLRFVEVEKIDSISSRINFTAIDIESDPIWLVPEYQFEGEPVWHEVEISGVFGRIGPFETSPAGVTGSIDWDMLYFPDDDRNVILRLRTISNPARVGVIRHVSSYLKEIGSVKPVRSKIAISTNIISLPTITLGDTASVDFVILNTGLTALSVNDIEFPSQEMWIGQPMPINISPGISDTLTIFYYPDESLEISCNLVISSNDPLNPAVQIPLQAKARPLDYSLVNFYTDGEIEQEMHLNVSLVMQDSTCSDSALVYFRKSGEIDFKNNKMNKIPGPVNDQYNIAISSDSIGLSGVEYFVGVSNHLANRFGELQRLRLCATNLAFPLVQPANKYSIISIPLKMQGTIGGLLSDDLGGRDVTQWRIFSYETDTISDIGSYVELPTESQYEFTQGRSYWLISKDSKYLDTGPLTGITAPTDSAFRLLLHPGWNMIGNPFNFPVSWESILVDTLTSGGIDTLTMAEAQSTAIGTSSPIAWVIGKGYQDTVSVLEPFDGYWVQNLLDTTIVLRIFPVKAPGTGAGLLLVAEAESPSDAGWRIRVKGSSCGAIDLNTYAGVREGAVDYYDRYDYPEPPATPGKYLSVYFPHRDWNRYRGDYSSDIRGECKSIEIPKLLQASHEEELWGNMWYLDVIKSFSTLSGGDEVTLEFTGLEDVPAEFAIYLVDNRLERFIDLRKNNAYNFFLGKRGSVTKEEDARFMLLVGSEDFVESHEDQLPELPGATALHQNYPNPFNPSTVIRYDIATPGHVELNIYDARGALVKVLVNRYREPGRYEVGWNGINDRGARVVSGIYFYRMRTKSETMTKKMILLR